MAEFVKVAKTSDLKPGKAKILKAKGKEIALYNVDGKFYATQNECTHEGGPLGEGDLDGKVVTCPWHASMFDVTTGKVLSPPASEDVKAYKVKVKGEDIFVEI
jgi:nitrite reductase/ring-hydroxylating ferredoxin subunit